MGLAEDVNAKVDGFENDHASQLQAFNDNYRLYRGIPTRRRGENQSNTFIPETLVEVEALATAVYEMLYSDNTREAWFDVVGEGDEDMARAIVTKAVLSKQMETVEFQEKLMPFLRMLILQGTWPVETPWVLGYKSYWDFMTRVRRPAFDSWDFQPFNIISHGFDDSQQDVEKMAWAYRLWRVNVPIAKEMVRAGIWDAAAVDKAMDEKQEVNTYWTQQRQDGGYFDNKPGKGFVAVEYYGQLDDKDDGEMYWAVVTRNGQVLKPEEINPYDHGEKPLLMGKWISLPEEPYGIGVGALNSKQQQEINDRRNFINDLLYASLYSMWLKRSDMGLTIPGGIMKYSPNKLLEADFITEEFLRPLRPDASILGPAVQLEASDRETMRRNSGATSTLQAIATGITATESQSIQSEATRRVKAMVRSQVATFLKRFLYRAHRLNVQFLDRPIVARLTNQDGNEMFGYADRRDLLMEPDIRMKVSTDLDARPFMRRELLEALNIFAQLGKAGILGDRRIIPDPIIDKLATTWGINPAKFFSKEMAIETETRRAMMSPGVQQGAMQSMVNGSQGAQQVLESMGAVG